MEEKILLPAARRIRGGEPLPLATRLRLDHGALTALLVPSPTVAIVAALRAILKANNPIEEDPGGIYDQCEELAGAEADSILQQLQAAPEVRVLPHVDNAFVMDAARRALRVPAMTWNCDAPSNVLRTGSISSINHCTAQQPTRSGRWRGWPDGLL
jgi:hypothetical protein